MDEVKQLAKSLDIIASRCLHGLAALAVGYRFSCCASGGGDRRWAVDLWAAQPGQRGVGGYGEGERICRKGLDRLPHALGMA